MAARPFYDRHEKAAFEDKIWYRIGMMRYPTYDRSGVDSWASRETA